MQTDQREIAGRYNFSVSGNNENCKATASQKRTERCSENGAATACSRSENAAAAACSPALRVARDYSFFTAQNKSAVENHGEMCLV